MVLTSGHHFHNSQLFRPMGDNPLERKEIMGEMILIPKTLSVTQGFFTWQVEFYQE